MFLRLIYPLSVLTLLSSCSLPSQLKRPEPLPQDPNIEVYFNQNQAQGKDYKDPYRNINRPGDNLEQILIDTLNTAGSTIDIAVQEFRLPRLAQALAKKHQEGIKIRIILENNYSRPISQVSAPQIDKFTDREQERYQDSFALMDENKDGKLSDTEINQGDALVILKNAGIPIIDDTHDGSKGSGLMHHKFIVVDGQTVIITSANFTLSDIHGDFFRPETRGNANHLMRIKNPQLAKIFTEEFNLMWDRGQFGSNKPYRSPETIPLEKSEITVKFSPDKMNLPWLKTSNGVISQALEKGKSSVNLALFVFSEQRIANVLENEHQKGVDIRVLIDPGFAFQNYSEGLDLLGVALSKNCRYEKDNHPWKSPINTVGVPQLVEGDKLHHKFGIIDDHTIITGSHNWSAAANYTNDENLVILKSPTVTAHFQREFDRLYENARLGVPQFVREKIATEQKKCPQIIQPVSSGKVINLNTATQEELETLPGIGPALAKRIIEAREKQPFTSLEDLDRVKGISENKLKKLAGKVTW